MLDKVKHYLHIITWKFYNNEERIAYLRKQGIRIGMDCFISSDVRFGTEPYLISIGNNVRLTSNVKFVTHDGSLWVLRNMGMTSKDADFFGKIIIGDNVNIGWNSIIMSGVTIGNNVIVGVNAVVTKSIPDNSVVAGVPARVIETIDEYYEKNKTKIVNTKFMGYAEKKEYLLSLLKN